jgi:hypothetical protein
MLDGSRYTIKEISGELIIVKKEGEILILPLSQNEIIIK